MGVRLLCRTALVAVLFLFTTSAFAHHVMGGATPSTLVEGLLSGIAHPVIGPDHLAFLLAIGIAVGIGGLNLALPALFVIASAIGRSEERRVGKEWRSGRWTDDSRKKTDYEISIE